MTKRMSNSEISACLGRIAISIGVLGCVLGAPLLSQSPTTPATLATDAATAVDRIVFTPARAATAPVPGPTARNRIQDVWSDESIPPPLPPKRDIRTMRTMTAMR